MADHYCKNHLHRQEPCVRLNAKTGKPEHFFKVFPCSRGACDIAKLYESEDEEESSDSDSESEVSESQYSKPPEIIDLTGEEKPLPHMKIIDLTGDDEGEFDHPPEAAAPAAAAPAAAPAAPKRKRRAPEVDPAAIITKMRVPIKRDFFVPK